MNNFTIKIYDNFYDVQKVWEEFEFNSTNTIFQSFNWLSLWYSVCVNLIFKSKPFIIFIYDKGQLVCIVPMCVTKYLGINILEWMGKPFSDFNIPIFSEKFIIDKFNFDFLWKNIIYNNLIKIDATYLINQKRFLGNFENPFVKYLANYFQVLSYSIDTSNSFEEYKKEKKINNQSSHRIDLKKLSKIGNITFQYDLITLQQKKESFEFFIKHKKNQLISTKAWNYLSKDYYVNFLQILSNKNKNSNHFMLKLNESVIASCFGYEYKKIFYYIFPTYDFYYKKYSPGIVLLDFMIKYYFEKKINFNFTIGEEEYKRRWFTDKEDIFYYNKYYSLSGFLFITFINTILLVKKNKIKKYFKYIYYFLKK